MLRPLPLLRGGSLIFLASPRSRGGTEGGEFLTFARGLLTPGALAPRMFTAGLLAWQPSFQQFWAIQSTVPHRTGQRLLRQGVLSQPSNLNLDAWKQFAGVFPRRLDIVLRYSGCDTLQRAIETFKTSIELIDPAHKPIQPPDTRRGEIKTFDPSSSSRFICGVNLKSKI